VTIEVANSNGGGGFKMVGAVVAVDPVLFDLGGAELAVVMPCQGTGGGGTVGAVVLWCGSDFEATVSSRSSSSAATAAAAAAARQTTATPPATSTTPTKRTTAMPDNNNNYTH
jgi:hypothetical protein